MTQNKIRVIGITGITGSGTSTVASMLKEHGGLVISADSLAHGAIKKGLEAYKEIIEVFGDGVLKSDGEIDRKALGVLVFGDENKKNRALLESIIHPCVLNKIKELISNCESSFVVIDAPLLIESGLYKECDEVWLVIATDDVRVSRIMERDCIDKITAEKRLKSRQNEVNLINHTDVIIFNNGDIVALQEQVDKKVLH